MTYAAQLWVLVKGMQVRSLNIIERLKFSTEMSPVTLSVLY